ncbi:gamma-glutamyltransferase [Allopusillimonas soli]|uniref:Glutathione hydrolase proenzyme n=1 Tax=Allopusillimonas soli TaxID=659016 RepID=A0A853F814_9BURK|nr:gamma-glutamyltransferase [Allopusillimonas soli]NYT35682.1 gamma-glutamyltransferase [Allopusillimonas soli]TEA76074.1 gamma-glutamyltransferase [Allopusillimonas soli]
MKQHHASWIYRTARWWSGAAWRRACASAGLALSLALAACAGPGAPHFEGQASACPASPQPGTRVAPVPSADQIRARYANPEAATGRIEHPVVRAPHYMASSANPLASRAGARILANGGSAIDAAIAMQMVLNLVEPQSSGIGGGAFVMVYDAQTHALQAYDGRETAPAAARGNRFMRDGKAIPFQAAVNSGLSVGVPGVVHALALAHQAHGRLDWAALFQPAIKLAQEGFAVSPRLHALLASNTWLRQQPAAAAYFYDAEGQPWPVGHVLRNPALAGTLRAIAAQGPKAFYQGRIARDMVRAIASHPVAGDMTLSDLAGYRARVREPLCMPYEGYRLCGMPPPSSGPLAVMQMLGILSHTSIASLRPLSLESVHLFAEAGRLAFADRSLYVADPDFVDVPVQAMLDPRYLRLRAGLIDAHQAMGHARPGDPAGLKAVRGQDASPELPSTSHIVAVDAHGGVVSMTTSIETAFGSKIFVDGFLLNNQLTDFSLSDTDDQGRLVANRVEPGKRPRSSMSPMIVFRQDAPVLAIGSPGGSSIINYVAKALLGVLDWGMNVQQAIDLPNFGSRNRETELEKGTVLQTLRRPLEAMGHSVREMDFPSGLQGIAITPQGLEGGADPRREGLAIGG